MTDAETIIELTRIQHRLSEAAEVGQRATREAIQIIEEMQRDCQRRIAEAQAMQQPDHARDQRKNERA